MQPSQRYAFQAVRLLTTICSRKGCSAGRKTCRESREERWGARHDLDTVHGSKQHSFYHSHAALDKLHEAYAPRCGARPSLNLRSIRGLGMTVTVAQ